MFSDEFRKLVPDKAVAAQESLMKKGAFANVPMKTLRTKYQWDVKQDAAGCAAAKLRAQAYQKASFAYEKYLRNPPELNTRTVKLKSGESIEAGDAVTLDGVPLVFEPFLDPATAPDEKVEQKYWLFKCHRPEDYADGSVGIVVVAAKTAKEAKVAHGGGASYWHEIAKAEYDYINKMPKDAEKLDLPKVGDRYLSKHNDVIVAWFDHISSLHLSGRRWILKPEE